MASLSDGALWVSNDYRNEESKYVVWPGEILAQTMLLALTFNPNGEVA